MTEKNFAQTSQEISDYAARTFRPEDDTLRQVRERSLQAGLPMIQVGAMDALHLEVLVRMSGAKKAVEIGTLAGYSGIAILRGLGEKGFLHTFEFDETHSRVAARSFRDAGLEGRVKIHLGAALEKLPSIEKEGPFDLIFIDADKVSYPAYLEWAVRNLRVGGVILADNTFGWGLITHDRFEDAEEEAAIRALQKYNAIASSDPRLRSTILPTGEGLTVSVRIS